MSIPPLVCSTPPPLEQCEDDKDPEDFDLQYNLSQEDDNDNEFTYGNFTTFHNFPTNTIESSRDVDSSKLNPDSATCIGVSNHNEEISQLAANDNLNCSIEISFEEDINIEDLNLNVNEEPNLTKDNLEINELALNKDTIVNTSKDLQSDIPCASSDISEIDCKISTIETNTTSVMPIEIPQVLDEDNDKLFNEADGENNECDSNLDLIEKTEKNIVEESALNTTEDDFEDFDAYQFTSIDDKPEIAIDSNNPWGNSNVEDVKFGDFTANFGEDDDDSKLSKTCVTEELTNTNISPQTHINIKSQNTEDNDDDFGDFDEFKCSSTEYRENVHPQEILSDTHSVLNFQSENEHQLIERINKVLQSIFQEEISETDSEICNNLDTSLGETWGYLKETDTRQPYMVNWNNSLAQKTLLKALCIDSRNILFGPKWSSSMPKYAVNLSAAPLMPQKQITQVNPRSEQTSNIEKTTNKIPWVDPFTSDGQEFTYAEALLLDLEHLMATLDQMAHNHSTLKISELLSTACNVDSENTSIETVPTDLDVFEATMSTKTDKIYSNTLNIQPMRQINLPDTHIFTPTDSETPRSKTIHYDTTHTILMPQQVTDVKTPINSFPSRTISPENDEYWEFQNFKGSDTKLPTNQIVEDKSIEVQNQDCHPKTNYTYETQVLQPIKLEPTMPTLNWPDPGEVKETFEDFSDFISKSPEIEKPMSSGTQLDVVFNIVERNTIENKVLHKSDQFDDDFEMFQSALPSNKNIPLSESEKSRNVLVNQNTSNFDIIFPKLDHVESDNISLSNTRQNEDIKQIASNSFKIDELKITASPVVKPIVNSNLLQPIPLISSITKQKAGQILQPLSLESYSQINWPNPGINLNDLSRFNPVESLQSFKSDTSNHSKNSSPVHNQKTVTNNQSQDEDIWGEFVSSIPKSQQALPKKHTTFVDDDEWTDFVSSPSVNPQNGLNTISLNVHTNSNIQKSTNSSKYPQKTNQLPLDIPTLNYITPKTSNQNTYNERHFQNL